MTDVEPPIATYVAPEPDLAFVASTAAFEPIPDPTEELIPPALNLKAPRMSTDSIDVQALYIQGVALTQQSVAALQLQVNNLNTTTQTHTTDIDALELRVDGHDTEIGSIDDSLATLTANLGLTDGNVTALEGRMDTAELNITDLEADVALKQNISEKNQLNGYPGLTDGKIADTQINRAGPDEGFWKGDTINAASSRENNFVVYDSVDNKLKPLTSTVVPTYWFPGAVADAIGALQTNKVSWSPDYDNGLARITANESAITTINTTSLPAKQDISQKNQNNGYVGVDGAGQVGISASNVRRGAMYLTNVCRLGIDGADWSPGFASGTISVWKVMTDTFYNYNNAYGAGFKGTTGKTFFKAARDALVSVKANLAFSVASATTNKFFTLRITPVDPARTPTPHQYNYGLINGTTGSQSYSFAVDIPLRVGDSLSLEWNFTLGGTANPTFQKDYTYLHITEASNGIVANDWFP